MRKVITTAAAVACGVGMMTGVAHANLMSFAGYQWRVFDGVGGLGQHWSASHTTVSGGILTEKVSGGVAAGVGNTIHKTYGTWQVTYRMTRGGAKYAILLMGSNHQEIDFAEDPVSDPNRQLTMATLHWGTGHGAANISQHRLPGDYTQWHTAGVIWTPNSVQYTMDGTVWATETNHIPTGPMHLAIQTNATGSTPCMLQVSSVSIK